MIQFDSWITCASAALLGGALAAGRSLPIDFSECSPALYPVSPVFPGISPEGCSFFSTGLTSRDQIKAASSPFAFSGPFSRCRDFVRRAASPRVVNFP